MQNTKPDFTEIGLSGLARYNGYVLEEILPELSGLRGRKIIKSMVENDAIIGSMLYAIEMIARQAKVEIIAASDANEDEQVAEFFRQALFEDMSHSWGETLSEILSFLPWGWCLMETCYKVRQGPDSNDPTKRSKFTDNKIGWRKFAIRSQDTLLRWQFDEDGGIQAMEQLSPPDFRLRVIPIDKALLFRTRNRKNNPEGKSILRNAYTSWYYKTNIQRIEAIGVERDLAGLPVFEAPADYFSSAATSDQQSTLNTLKSIASSIRRDESEGLVIPLQYDSNGNKMFDFKLVSSGGQRQFDTDKILERYSRQILMCCLADFIMLGHEAVGSFALSSEKSGLFAAAMSTFLEQISDVFNRYEFPRLAKYNGIKPEQIPTLKFGKVESVDLESLADYIVKLSGVGAINFPTENGQLERYLLEQAKLPAVEEDDGGPQDQEEDKNEEQDAEDGQQPTKPQPQKPQPQKQPVKQKPAQNEDNKDA